MQITKKIAKLAQTKNYHLKDSTQEELKTWLEKTHRIFIIVDMENRFDTYQVGVYQSGDPGKTIYKNDKCYSTKEEALNVGLEQSLLIL